MAFPHQHQSTVPNGLLAALPPEDLARLRPSLHRSNSPSTRRCFRRTAPSRRCCSPRAAWCPARHAGRRGAGRGRDRRPGGPDRRPLIVGDDRSLVEARVQLEGTALRMDAAALRDGMGESAALRGAAAALRPGLALASHADRRGATRATRSSNASPAGCSPPTTARGDEFAMTHEFMAMMLACAARGSRSPPVVLQRPGDPVRPRPDGRHGPARPRSHELRVLPRRSTRVHAPARVQRRDAERLGCASVPSPWRSAPDRQPHHGRYK